MNASFAYKISTTNSMQKIENKIYHATNDGVCEVIIEIPNFIPKSAHDGYGRDVLKKMLEKNGYSGYKIKKYDDENWIVKWYNFDKLCKKIGMSDDSSEDISEKEWNTAGEKWDTSENNIINKFDGDKYGCFNISEISKFELSEMSKENDLN